MKSQNHDAHAPIEGYIFIIHLTAVAWSARVISMQMHQYFIKSLKIMHELVARG